MKISIIISVYNVAPYIEDCIRSVLNQTWNGDIECVIVDDGSTNNSISLAEELLVKTDSPIRFHIIRHEKNLGLSAARNSGINAATGDYMYFLDSDDEITSDCLERIVQPLQDELYDIVVSDYRIVGNYQKIPLQLVDGSILRDRQILHAYRKQGFYMMAVNKLYRSGFLRNNQLHFFSGIVFEDELWSFQNACMAKSLAVVGKITYLYKIRMDSTTFSKFSAFKARCLNVILKEMCSFACQKNLKKHPDAYNIIQNFRIANLYRVRKEIPELFQAHYVQQREIKYLSWWDCCRMNGCDWRKQIRDFHLALPVSLALPYMKHLLNHY